MSRKGLLLFLATGFAWGVPYFFIRVAVPYFSTETIIFSRVLIGAAILIPFAIANKAIVPALKEWRWLIPFALIEMVVPWFLITDAEHHVTSGLAGLMIATTPFWALIIAYFIQGDKSVTHPKTIIGLVIGFAGVLLLVGIDSLSGHLDLINILKLVVSAVAYAVGPAIAAVKLGKVASAGVMSLSMVIVMLVYAVPTFINLPGEIAAHPPIEAWLSLGGLGVICSAIAFIVFFELVKEIGSARATLITYVNTAVALALGIAFLHEPLTTGIAIGFPLVLIGSYWASKKH